MQDFMRGVLEFRLLRPEHESGLKVFFAQLVAAKLDKRFHPHPFTEAEATIRCNYTGKDLYYVVVMDNNQIVGYGMLRGWEEGYEIPSLGIALLPSASGMGLGTAFMHFLHVAARQRGASQIRLKVYPENQAAVALYQKLGYRFEEQISGQLVGCYAFK